MSHTQIGINDLPSQRPDLMNQWDYEKNENIEPESIAVRSNKKVWWFVKRDILMNQQQDQEQQSAIKMGALNANRRRLSKPVRCIETGECFQTIKEASQKTGISKDSITKNLTGKNKSAGGYHWEHIKIDINENN